MKKIESLKKLLEIIEVKGKLSSAVYCKGENNCVIGHFLKIGGVTQEQLMKIDNGVYGHNYAIGSILKGGKIDFVNSALEALGFDTEEDGNFLNDIQEINDDSGIKAVIKHLEEAIEKLKLEEK